MSSCTLSSLPSFHHHTEALDNIQSLQSLLSIPDEIEKCNALELYEEALALVTWSQEKKRVLSSTTFGNLLVHFSIYNSIFNIYVLVCRAEK